LQAEPTKDNVPKYLQQLLEEGYNGLKAYEKSLNGMKSLKESYTTLNAASYTATKNCERKLITVDQ